MTDNSTAIGIDLGGTNIKAVLTDASGNILKSLTGGTYNGGSLPADNASWKNTIAEMVQTLQQESKQPVQSIGLAAPGLSNGTNEVIAFMPGRLHGLENFEWKKLFNHPQVKVLNDAHAALIAESRQGAGKNIRNLLMLTLGTGVGGALMIDGKLHQGFLQRAGHAGHMSLDSGGSAGILGIPGTLEEAFGNAAVYKRSHGRFASCAAMADAYLAGDTIARFFWLSAIQKLSLGLVSLINILSPDLIILGGGITKAGPALTEPLSEFMTLYEWRPGGAATPVRLAAFNEFAGAVGAAYIL